MAKKKSNSKQIIKNANKKTLLNHFIHFCVFLFPIFIFIFFNILKKYFFDGFFISIIEFIILLYSLVTYYYILNFNICFKTSKQLLYEDNVINLSLFISLLIILIIKLGLYFNPYRYFMPDFAIYIIIFIFLYIISFLFSIIENSLKKEFCNYNMGYIINIILLISIIILIALHI